MKKIISIILIIMLTMCFTSCSQNADNERPAQTGAKTRISIASGNTGGVFYTLGAGMADIINNKSNSLEAVCEATAGTSENLNLIDKGEAEIGFCMSYILSEATLGIPPYTKEYDKLRIVVMGHSGVMHAYTTANSGIESIADFEGKRVAHAPGDIGISLLGTALKSVGVEWDDVKTQPMSLADTNIAIQDNTIDAGFHLMGLPGASFMELSNLVDVKFIPFSDEELAKIVELQPAWKAGAIPANTYKGQSEEIKTFEVPYALFTSADVPDQVIYDFMDTILSNTDQLAQIHVEGQYYNIDNPLYKDAPPVPYHDGALKYLKEKGIIE